MKNASILQIEFIKISKYLIIFVLIINLLNFVISVDFSDPTGGDRAYTNVNSVHTPEKERLWSEERLCEFVMGCFEDHICYPFGYVKDNTYCYDKAINYSKGSFYRAGFVNQSTEGADCFYDFQCESNFCFNRQCVGNISSLVFQLANRIESLEFEIEKVNQKNVDVNEIIETRDNLPEDPDKKEDVSFFGKIFGFGK